VDEIETAATLAATSIDGAELDAVVAKLAAIPAVRQAFWSPSTSG
jgi:putative Mg2+ transporter-C (MgtC) family protein